MSRTDVIQKVIDQQKATNYLEIGVNNGFNFFRIRAPRKTGVDPKFCYTLRRKVSWNIKNWSNWKARYCEITSDQYFTENPTSVPYDVVFIDGLHTHEQSLKDVLNALNRLTPKGVIIMHDCNPPNAAAATPAASLEQTAKLNIPGMADAWCGDVWKTICYLRSQRKDLNVFVLDCDYGLGVVTQGTPDSMIELSSEQLAKMTYEDLAKNKDHFLNLKNENYLFDFLARRR